MIAGHKTPWTVAKRGVSLVVCNADGEKIFSVWSDGPAAALAHLLAAAPELLEACGLALDAITENEDRLPPEVASPVASNLRLAWRKAYGLDFQPRRLRRPKGGA